MKLNEILYLLSLINTVNIFFDLSLNDVHKHQLILLIELQTKLG